MIINLLRRTGIALLLGILIFLPLTRCTNSDEIGLNLTPPGDRFRYVVDSSTVVTATTIRQDSLTTEKRTASLLGCMNDPVFGQTTAHLLTQLRLSSNEVDFGSDPHIDSAIIIMKYSGYYGDTSQLQTFRVYELTRDIYYDSTYYSSFKMDGFFDPAQPVGEMSYYPHPGQDSLEVRLNDDFGDKLIHTDTAYLSSNSTWLDYFKGLYFESEPVQQGGSISYFDFANGNSRMVLYYHNELTDSLKYEVVINSNCSWFNLFSHSYDGAPISGEINDSLYTHPDVYIQSMAGLRGHINLQLPQSVLNLVNSGISINKAELILPVEDDPTEATYPRPLTMRVFNTGANNTNVFIDDFSLGEDYYGGMFDSKTSSYRFNIARYLQEVLHPDSTQRIPNDGLLLVITDERTAGNRVIMKNGIADGGMKLVVTYTPVN